MQKSLSFPNTVVKNLLSLGTLLLAGLLLAGCIDSEDGAGRADIDFDLSMDLPDSLTGGQGGQSQSKSLSGKSYAGKSTTVLAENDNDLFVNCEYAGPEDDDIFKNGYNMTQFMVSGVASWTCIGDVFIELGALLPAKNEIIETKHDADDPDYDPEEPTHFRVKDSSGSSSIYLYYGYGHSEPLPDTATPGFYVNWQENGDGTTGTMIIDTDAINNPARDPEDPVQVRMDFSYTEDQKLADMYMRFDDQNQWANGFRIQVVEDLTAAASEQVFLARGKIDTIDQYADVDGISELPVFDLYTVSDSSGKGAAHAEFSDLGLSMAYGNGKHLGDYLVNKLDLYYFDSDGSWDWVEKTFTNTELRGNNRNLTSGELDFIESPTVLDLPSDYFTAGCNTSGVECDDLINAIFDEGWEGQEPNQGTEQNDWRSTALETVDYLDSVYPAGSDSWSGVFDID